MLVVVDLPELDRFWLPVEAGVPLVDRGFMPDPSSASSSWMLEARRFDEIAQIGCLVLVGEPGLGKTTALQRERARLEALGELIHPVDLSTTQDEAVLRSKIFDGHTWDSWRRGGQTLNLFLDSLDFALLRLETVVDVLRDGLDTVAAQRLKVRLACRTSERQADLESWLRRSWGADGFAVYELAPLRFRDVVESAQTLEDPNGFVTAIIGQRLQPLAMTPMTLRMLLEVAESQGSLPRSRRELYERGCLRLCDEVGESRKRARRNARGPTVTERFAVAQRLGGLLILSAKAGVNEDEVGVASLAGGVEVNDQLGTSSEFDVHEAIVRDVMGCGLFTKVGVRLQFVHQTYGEFLCGRWLAKCFTPRQLDDLLFAATDEGLRVIPQLRETAGWVAAHCVPFAQLLVERDPAVLLRADPFTTLADERELMVDALLRCVGSFELGRFDLPVRMALEHLAHPNLAEQLRESLADPHAGFGAREMAADIARACHVIELQNELLGLAQDDSAEIGVRQAAAAAVGSIGSAEARRGLVDLAINPPDADLDDELKGTVLAAVWPQIMTLDELLPTLTTPKRRNLYGSYKQFLRVNFCEGLSDDQLARALVAAVDWPDTRRSPLDALADAREQLKRRALKHLDRDDVVAAYARLLFSEPDLFGGPTSHATEEDFLAKPTPRRRLALETATCAHANDLDGSALVLCHPPLIRREDVGWLLDRLREAVGTEKETVWAQAAEAMLFGTPPL